MTQRKPIDAEGTSIDDRTSDESGNAAVTHLRFRQVRSTLPPVTSDAILSTLRVCAQRDVFLLSEEAITRMRDGQASQADLRNVLMQAVRCEQEAGDDLRWRVFGPSLDGVEMSIVVSLQGGMVTVL